MTRRLSDDWHAVHGPGMPVAETFHDPERFCGARCSAAARWLPRGIFWRTATFAAGSSRWTRCTRCATRRRLQLGKGDAIRAMTRVFLTAAMRGTRAFRATGTSPRDSIGRESSGVEKAGNRQKAERPGKNIPPKAAWESPVSYLSLTEKANTGRKILFTFPAISEMVS